MADSSTEQAEIIVETALSLLRSQFPVFSEFIGNGGGIARGGCGFAGVRLVVFVVVVVAVAVVAGGGLLALIIGFVVGSGIGFVGFVGFAFSSAGLLAKSFPVTGIDGMR